MIAFVTLKIEFGGDMPEPFLGVFINGMVAGMQSNTLGIPHIIKDISLYAYREPTVAEKTAG